MQKKKQIKEIILITIIVILLLLIMFSEDIIKLQNKNKIGLSENAEQELTNTTNEPNVPTTSAGMIPIKWDGNYWTITTKEDNTWYDYSNNQPAYIMLNDGTYQSELIRNMEGKKLAEQNIGAQIQENELGTIFVWIPRFEINDNEEINYIKDTGTAEEGWTIPELFEYKQEETKPDYILTGTWVEKEIDANATSKITEMNKEEGTYGFLAHTKATKISTNEITELQKYTLANTLEDIANKNRITLKIIDENKQEPIKATAYYSEQDGMAVARVTYSQYGISKILYDETELEIVKNGGIILANTKTTGIFVTKGEHKVTIIDNKNNIKKFYVYKNKIYANLYFDGTLAFSTEENPELNKELVKAYGDIQDEEYGYTEVPWWYERTNITAVMFNDMIYPHSTSYWFYGCSNLTTFENMSKLQTNCTISMRGMFYSCTSLTALDVSSFDTSNVTNMWDMFSGCSGLTKLDVSNFNTSNVTNMISMFSDCKSLTSLDLSRFNTSNVTRMNSMFSGCSGLTKLDVSNFNTSKVTEMDWMFSSCSGLTKLDLSRFDTRNVTDMSYMFGNCSGLTKLDLSRFDTRNVTNMKGIFKDCSHLKSLDVSNFNTSKVTVMGYMFYDCISLTELDVSNFDTSNVTYMKHMFNSCVSLTALDLSSFNTSNVTNMEGMFYGLCYGYSKLTKLDISNFDTSNVTNMNKMFNVCTNLKTIYVGEKWSTSQATTDEMFEGCGTSSVTKKS